MQETNVQQSRKGLLNQESEITGRIRMVWSAFGKGTQVMNDSLLLSQKGKTI